MKKPSCYHIETHVAPPKASYPANFLLADGDVYVKYGHPVFAGSSQRGDAHWTAEVITQTWYQSETGRVPISGAGYGGKFAGEGFEGIWLNMSEIVRPTRDGIHGRETISTQVDLGGGVEALSFSPGEQVRLTRDLPPALSLPLPVVFNPLPIPLPGRGATRALASAAARLGTLALVDPNEFDMDLAGRQEWLAPRFVGQVTDVNWQPRYVEIEWPAGDHKGRPYELMDEARRRWQRIVNLYTAWLWQLAGILQILGMRSIAELRGRSDLLVYLE